jgi:hypothetical protein
MCACVSKILSYFETSENSPRNTASHRTGPNRRLVLCGSLWSRNGVKEDGHKLRMVSVPWVCVCVCVCVCHSLWFKQLLLPSSLSSEHYADLYMFSRVSRLFVARIMRGINQGVEITTERHRDSCVYRWLMVQIIHCRTEYYTVGRVCVCVFVCHDVTEHKCTGSRNGKM